MRREFFSGVVHWLVRLPQRCWAAFCRMASRHADSITVRTLRERIQDMTAETESVRQQNAHLNARVELLEAEKSGLAEMNEANLQRVRAIIAVFGGEIGGAQSRAEKKAKP